jgi:hypothetical protein|nr:MAG TPA: hypothetical protein [Herelleviridae sp.]
MLVVIFLGFIYFYLLIRNKKVYLFREYLRVRAYDEIHRVLKEDIDKFEPLFEEWSYVYKRHSYSKMVFIPRPLKSRYWFTAEEIKKFNL